MEQEQVNTKLDAGLARQVKAQAALQGRTLKDVIGEAASEWLAKARDEAKARSGGRMKKARDGRRPPNVR